MLTRLPIAVALAVLALAPACKNEREMQVEQTVDRSIELTNKGRAALADKRYQDAVKLFSEVTNLTPTDAQIYLLLAEAQKRAGNEAAAVMALKQAEALVGKADPAVRRERAGLYQRMGQTKDAIALFSELRDANQLTDPETLGLAHMQARSGDIDGAWASLESVQKRKPDDPEAKAIEAEVLLLKGEEVLGARLLDRLAQDYPQQASARLARARYFFANGLAAEALQDLDQVTGEAAKDPELVALKARMLLSLKKYDDTLAILKPLADANPKNADFACLLAETLLMLNRTEEAEALVDQAVALRPDFARAIYVRGRSQEANGQLPAAIKSYEEAMKADPAFAQALSRLWPMYEHQGQKGEAIAALERLVVLKEASPDEKLALVTLYVSINDNPTRAKALLEDVARKKPGDPRIKELKAQVAKMKTGKVVKNHGIIIMRRGK